MARPKLLVPAIYLQHAPIKKLIRFNRINDTLYIQIRRIK